MDERPITVKMMPEALRLLRLVAAQTGELQRDVLTRLLTDEARKLKLPVDHKSKR